MILGFDPKSASPPEFYLGNIAVQEKIRELWEQYYSVIGREQIYAPRQEEDNSRQELKTYLERLGFLNIFVISYPEVVEYIVPPISMLLSVTPGLPYNFTWGKSLVKGAKALAKISLVDD